MSKQALKRVRKAIGLPVCRDELPSYAWPGGYPLFYVFSDGGVCCPDCANKEITEINEAIKARKRFRHCGWHGGWALTAVDVNYEDADMVCDHCGKAIEAAYVDSK